MQYKHDLAWGCPIVVREALRETLGKFLPNNFRTFDEMGYTPHCGSETLIEQLKFLAQRQSGHRPKHLIVTCGATGGINAALSVLKDRETQYVVTNKRYFPFYPEIIRINDLVQITNEERKQISSLGGSDDCFISLIDSPSNPEGLMSPFKNVDIWDNAYGAFHYSCGIHVPSKWKIMVGSLSKTLGLSGLRIGWVSTDDDNLAIFLNRYVTYSYCGLSAVSMDISEEILSVLDHSSFEMRAGGYLDDNREELQKLLDKFGQGSVPSTGMFAILQLGKIEKRALERAKVKYQPGSSWGEDDTWARLSLGQNREITRNAVKAILK